MVEQTQKRINPNDETKVIHKLKQENSLENLGWDLKKWVKKYLKV